MDSNHQSQREQIYSLRGYQLPVMPPKIWQRRKDSNLRMPESKSGALTNLATPLRCLLERIAGLSYARHLSYGRRSLKQTVVGPPPTCRLLLKVRMPRHQFLFRRDGLTAFRLGD